MGGGGGGGGGLLLVHSFMLVKGDPDVLSNLYDIRRTLVGNDIVDHSDVVGASPVGADPTTSSFSI